MSTVDAMLNTISLDPGDSGLVFIPGVGFRPADGIEIGATRVLNECVIKCHLGYDDLPDGPVSYVPVCGGEDGIGKWAGKWTPPIDWTTPETPLWTPLVPTPVYTTPDIPIWTTPIPWDTPWTYCCSTTPQPDPWVPPETPAPVDLPATGLLLGSILIGATIIRAAQTFRLAAAIKDQT